MSDDVKESKQRKVFICEYEPVQNPIIINDSLRLNISEVWLERRWKYPRNYNRTYIMEGYQLILLSKDDINKGYFRTWTIGVDGNRYFRTCDNNCLISDFDSLPMGRSETWKVQAGSKLSLEEEKEIISEITLLKMEVGSNEE